jgi:dolichol-phosphate mannosyltransferase
MKIEMERTRESATASPAPRRRLITVSIPILNEEDNLRALLSKLDTIAAAEADYQFEFLFTDNASTDGSFELLTELAKKDARIRALRFSRNFGFQKSILTNFLNARGDAAIQIDADMQDPPEMISDFLRKWEEGYKVVYGIRRHRRESRILHWARRTYYKFVSAISETDVPRDAGDFRLVDRSILDHLHSVEEQTPYLRGLIASLGYAQIGLLYDRSERKFGVSKFKLLQLIELGLDGITAQSVRPLRLITMFGFLVTFFAIIGGLYYFIIRFFLHTEMPSGFTTIILFLLFLIGLNAFLLGIIGEYVGRIFNNTRGLPLTIIERRIEPISQTLEVPK